VLNQLEEHGRIQIPLEIKAVKDLRVMGMRSFFTKYIPLIRTKVMEIKITNNYVDLGEDNEPKYIMVIEKIGGKKLLKLNRILKTTRLSESE
jgi:hypothetical protein